MITTKPKLKDSDFSEKYYDRLFGKMQEYFEAGIFTFDFIELNNVVEDYGILMSNDYYQAWHLCKRMIRVQEELNVFAAQVQKELDKVLIDLDYAIGKLETVEKGDKESQDRLDDQIIEFKKSEKLLKAIDSVIGTFYKRLNISILYCSGLYTNMSNRFKYKKFMLD